MKNKFFVIGNGFDLAHKLPTNFDPDFKKIARINGTQLFWELYQIHEEDIWSALLQENWVCEDDHERRMFDLQSAVGVS